MTQTSRSETSLYETDYVAWADEQAMLLEQKRWDELDLVNLVEEVKDLSGRHRDALESQLTRLLMHLLKWQFQPSHRSNSWAGTIKEARKQIARLTRKHPVLKLHVFKVYVECYLDAREDAADETGLPVQHFPWECPYLVEEALDCEFFPEPEAILEN
jgi:ribosomal protein L29